MPISYKIWIHTKLQEFTISLNLKDIQKMLFWNTYCFKFHVTPHSKLNGFACDENTFISTDNSTSINLYV